MLIWQISEKQYKGFRLGILRPLLYPTQCSQTQGNDSDTDSGVTSWWGGGGSPGLLYCPHFPASPPPPTPHPHSEVLHHAWYGF